jgi:hypothetical protein
MVNLIEVSLDENTKIYLEAAQDDIIEGGQFEAVRNPNRVIEKAKDYFDGTLNQIKTFANSIAHSVKDLVAEPDEVELEFSVKFAAEAGIVISSLSSEASVTIKLKWINPK